MLLSIIKALAICSGISLLLSSASVASQPEIHEYYPQCEYTHLDVVTVKHKIKYVNKQITDENIANATQLLMTKLLNIAAEKNAQIVLIIDREIDQRQRKINETSVNLKSKSSLNYYYLSFTAQLAAPCEPVTGYAKKLTPYNKLGVKQQGIKIGTIKGWEMQINLNTPANQRQSPMITDRTISASTGFFGIALETPYSQVIAKLGTPTFAMQFNDRQQLLAYGRDIWLTFKDKKLVHVTNQTIWLSRESMNMLDFDERFEKQDWLLEGKIIMDQSFEEAKRLIVNSGSSDKLSTNNNKSTLHIHTEASRNSHTKEYTNTVTGFTLELSDSAIYTTAKLSNTSVVTQVISTYIGDTDRAELLTKKLKTLAIGRARIDATSELLFYDNHLVVEMQGSSINKLHYIEKVFAKHPPEDPAWTFNRVSQGQSIEKVMQILGPDAFNFDDTVEVEGSNYTKKLFFESVDGQNKLIAAKVSVY